MHSDMASGNAMKSRVGLMLVVIVLCGIAGATYFRWRVAGLLKSAESKPPPMMPSTAPATQAAVNPTSAPLPPPKEYMDVVLRTYPKMPTTQPLGVPLEMSDAAHLILHDPIYVCSRQDLWITHA